MTEANQSAVEKCAALARLELAAGEAEKLSEDFDHILEAFRGLSELDVSEVEPMLGAAELRNILREDQRTPSLEREALLAPAPKREDGFYSVPKTLESRS